MPIQVEVWGDYACFTRPEMKTERVSYDVMTPSAARGLLDSLYWHPGLRWVIDRSMCAPPSASPTSAATRSKMSSAPAGQRP